MYIYNYTASLKGVKRKDEQDKLMFVIKEYEGTWT